MSPETLRPRPQDTYSSVVACSLQELIALRKLQKSQLRQGIDVAKLNRGSDPKKRKARVQGEGEAEGEGDGEDEVGSYGLQPRSGKPSDTVE